LELHGSNISFSYLFSSELSMDTVLDDVITPSRCKQKD